MSGRYPRREARATQVAPTALPTVSGGPAGSEGRSCAICGVPLTGFRASARYCSSACRARAYDRRTGRRPATGTRITGWHVPLAHPTYAVEPCPRCGFPEADGGACASCGWTLPRPGTPGGWHLYTAGTVCGPVRGRRP